MLFNEIIDIKNTLRTPFYISSRTFNQKHFMNYSVRLTCTLPIVNSSVDTSDLSWWYGQDRGSRDRQQLTYTPFCCL